MPSCPWTLSRAGSLPRLREAELSAAITRDEMAVWSRYIQEISGIHLDETKGYLVETRLGRLLPESGAANFSELFHKVKTDTTAKLRGKIIEAITTNETSFFRDVTPFDLLRHKLIPDLIDRRKANGARVPLRIWSAACSTGQEAYSTAIVLKELLGDLTRYDIRILGTDISNKAVAQASYAEYGHLELERGLPREMLARYFTASGERWKVRDRDPRFSQFPYYEPAGTIHLSLLLSTLSSAATWLFTSRKQIRRGYFETWPGTWQKMAA